MNECIRAAATAHMPVLAKNKAGPKSESPKPKPKSKQQPEIRRGETIPGIAMLTKTKRECSSIFKFYGTNKSAKQAAKIAHADGGGNAAVVRGGVALIHTILFGKLNAT